MDDSKVFMFPDSRTSNIDPGLLALINNNGGFGNGGNWMWMMFLWFLYPMMMANGGWGNGFGGNNNAFPYLANMGNNDTGRELLLQAINGRADALGQLATMLNTSVETVKSGITSLQAQIQNVGAQVGMSGLQVINAIQAGDASLSQQLASCCCESRLATLNQTNALQSQAASNFAATQLQLAQNEAADQLSVCQQTQAITTQAERNTNSILNAISAQNTMITKEFCDIKERELQSKIDTQGDIITQLRGQISNDKQSALLQSAINGLDAKINAIAAKQPNTIPVTYPNVVAMNTTPYSGGYGCNGGCGCNGNSYWG